MAVIKLDIHVLYQKLFGAGNIEHKDVSVENALQNQCSMEEVISGYARMFPSLSAPVYYILIFVDLTNNRQLELRQCGNKSVSSLVQQNINYCSNVNTINMMMYFFTLAPSTPITESEFSVEFYVKVHIYNAYDRLHTVAFKKHFFTDSNSQTPISEIMKHFTQLTLDESGEEVDENEEENVFYHLMNSDDEVSLTSNVPVQQFVRRHREKSPHRNRIIITIHAFYIEKLILKRIQYPSSVRSS